jgi:hypothetical protein
MHLSDAAIPYRALQTWARFPREEDAKSALLPNRAAFLLNLSTPSQMSANQRLIMLSRSFRRKKPLNGYCTLI